MSGARYGEKFSESLNEPQNNRCIVIH
jgi:hypothetical protein